MSASHGMRLSRIVRGSRRSSSVSWKCRVDCRKPSAQRGGSGARPSSSATSPMQVAQVSADQDSTS
jgi:hypothetical protein